MPRHKCETLSIRTTADIKDLVRQAAETNHRSVASMIEVLILDYAKQHLPTSGARRMGAKKAVAKKQNGNRMNNGKQ